MLGLFKSKKKTGQAKILVIDDQPDLVNTIQFRLKSNNFKVITASNGQEGLEKIASEKPDLVLLDTNMPVMDGREMLKRLRSDPQLKDTKVIMLTALCEARDIEIVNAYGISDYVAKPFEFSQLLEKITAALQNDDS